MENFLRVIVDGARSKQPPARMTTRIIAIDGPGGAGKSSLAEILSKELDRAPIVYTDDFASWDSPVNWWPRLIEEVLEPLSRNERARYRRSDWQQTGRERSGEVSPADFVILEGVTASREAFRPYLAYSIWVETPRDLRLRRGVERDGEELRTQWEEWMAGEDHYVAREKPQEKADLILPGDRDLWT